MAGDQRVAVGAGAAHPVQGAVHAQPGLVEPGHVGGGDALKHAGEELAQPVGGPLGATGEPVPGKRSESHEAAGNT